MDEPSDLRTLLEEATKREQLVPMESPLMRLLSRKVRKDVYNERAGLENKLAVALLHVSSIEKEQKLLQVEKVSALRLQRALLKKSFLGSKRHVCPAMKLDF
jgi:hypothetical protein